MRKITILFVTMFTLSLVGQVKLTSSLHESENNGVWEGGVREIFLYDSFGNLSSNNLQFWDDDTSSWGYSELSNYTYNSNNILIEEVFQHWDSYIDTPAFINSSRTTYNYNSSNELVEYISYYWQNDSWYTTDKTVISFYSDGKRSEKQSFMWNGTGWTPLSRDVISYGGNGKVSNVNSENYNGTDWDVSSVATYTYNGINKLLLELHQEWNGSVFLESRKYEYIYDGNGNLINKKSYYPNINGVLELSSNETNTFDTNALMSSFTHPFLDSTGLDYEFIEFPYINKILNISYSNQRITYNYGEATANINSFDIGNIKVYPNPTNSVLIIDDGNFTLKNVEVYNLLGKRVMTTTKNKLNLQNLVNGLYFVKVQDENGSFATKKIVKM